MFLVSTPSAVFHASDWNSVVTEPIGPSQCLRIAPKNIKQKALNTRRGAELSHRQHP